MGGLGFTIARLSLSILTTFVDYPKGAVDRLRDIGDFGSNPGELRARSHVPSDIGAGAALVVVLHGCTQTAAAYDHGSGWSKLADEQKFAVLFPEQQRSNNPNRCFNWFADGDAERDAGEAHSIRQMIEFMVVTNDLDRRRIFVTGLSAGGAMASVMLATYPEVFAGGAIIAGLPYGAAASMGDAFARMRGQGYPTDETLGEIISSASDHDGPWPSIAIWQGTADQTVDPSNAMRIVGQWCAVVNIPVSQAVHENVGNFGRQIWIDADGKPAVAFYEIEGMGHGTPLDTQEPESCGHPGPYMLEAGISSTLQSALSWDLSGASHDTAVAMLAAETSG